MKLVKFQYGPYEELKLVCDLAHDLGTPVVGHVRNAKGVKDSIKAGMDMILACNVYG